MKIGGAHRIPASPEKVWAALLDPDALRAAIPGCSEVVRIGDNEFAVAAKVKLGPLGLRVKGKLRLSDLDPPRSCRIRGEGTDRAAGFAKGDAQVRLEEADDGETRLTYHAEAKVGGKIAQLGARLIDAAAQKYADQFFGALAAQLGGGAATADNAKAPDDAAAAGGAKAAANGGAAKNKRKGLSPASKISLAVFAALALIALLTQVF